MGAIEARYRAPVSALRACPFCRSLFRREEGSTCAECGVKLVPLQELPPSAEALQEEPLSTVLPEDQPLPWADFSRGRGALMALSVLGLALFFTAWVEVILPETSVRSGFDLARGRAGWLWGGAVGYFVLLPLVFTRRTITSMRGVRIAVTLLAATTFGEVCMLLLMPPQSRGLVPVSIEWRWGLYASGLVSLCAAALATRFGGSLPELPGEASASSTLAAGGDPPVERRTLH